MAARSNPETAGTPGIPPNRFLIIDDHALVRDGMTSLLSALYPGSECIEARNASEAVDAVQADPGIGLVLLDLLLPEDDGFELLERLGALLPGAVIAVVSASEDPEHIRRAYDAGVRGYIPKSADQDIMRLALPLMLSGETYVPAVALDALRNSVPGEQTKGISADQPEGRQNLTSRQREILSLIANGLTNREIADTLNLLEGTVKVHVKTILLKLDAANRTHAVIQAVRMGIISPDAVDADSDWEV